MMTFVDGPLATPLAFLALFLGIPAFALLVCFVVYLITTTRKK